MALYIIKPHDGSPALLVRGRNGTDAATIACQSKETAQIDRIVETGEPGILHRFADPRSTKTYRPKTEEPASKPDSDPA